MSLFGPFIPKFTTKNGYNWYLNRPYDKMYFKSFTWGWLRKTLRGSLLCSKRLTPAETSSKWAGIKGCWHVAMAIAIVIFKATKREIQCVITTATLNSGSSRIPQIESGDRQCQLKVGALTDYFGYIYPGNSMKIYWKRNWPRGRYTSLAPFLGPPMLNPTKSVSCEK